MRGSRNKKLLVLIVLTVVGFFLTAYLLGSKQNTEKKPGFLYTFFGVPEQTCQNQDFIEYLHYPDPPPNSKNNKVGIYIYAESKDFINLADRLVNSSGGDWGYVLIPYNMSDRDHTKWRVVFDLLYDKHLIPIIQLNALDLPNYQKQTIEAAQFLNEFPWPVKQRYISVYNEPNDDKFWFEDANAGEYAQILDYTIKTFKQTDSNYFMLNGALNVSAASGSGYIDAFDFMWQMNQEVPGIFAKLDGWASHSYPQPNFSGSPFGTGRQSIRAYETELEYLKNTLGVQKDLPVFITETGWAHAEGEVYNPQYLSASQVAQHFKTAYEQVWLPDNRVQAVTPFTIWYDAPFDHFSWVDKDNNPYPQFGTVKDLPKESGTPQAYILDKITTPCPNQLQD